MTSSALADLLAARTRPGRRREVTLRTGTVETVAPAGHTVDLGSGHLLGGLRALASYTPAVGDRVALLTGDGIGIILGRLT